MTESANRMIRKMIRLGQRDAGAALVTVLLLVAVMAAGAVVTFDALGYTVKRGTARRMFDQARYYALGGEQLAITAAEKLTKAKVKLKEPQVVAYPIDGGRIEGFITDASNCFNINSLVDYSDAGRLQGRPATIARYERLLTLLGLSDREAAQLSAATVDWLDTDNRPVPSGAEDYDYAALEVPYRTANALIRDLSELVLVRGYTDEVLALVTPYLCASDKSEDSVLNVNSLQVRDAPLLAALIGGDFGLARAADVIASRPSRGYDDIADFWFERAFTGRTIGQDVRSVTDVEARRYLSQIKVRYHDGISRLTSVIRVSEDGTARLVHHQFGVFQ